MSNLGRNGSSAEVRFHLLAPYSGRTNLPETYIHHFFLAGLVYPLIFRNISHTYSKHKLDELYWKIVPVALNYNQKPHVSNYFKAKDHIYFSWKNSHVLVKNREKLIGSDKNLVWISVFRIINIKYSLLLVHV